MGKLMSAVRPKVVDRADENLVSQIVKEYLNSKYKKRTQCKLSSFFLFLWFSLKLNHKVQWEIIVIGRNEITIENHKGIMVFEKDRIKINTNMSPIEIKGNSFEILYIASATITIKGYFDSIEYVRWMINGFW